jgi:3-methyladenine DNA glycosylase AlkD
VKRHVGVGDSTLQQSVRRALRRAADPSRAAAMQAYMKSEMPYLGVTAPKVRGVCREVFASYAFVDAMTWRSDVLSLWRGAEHREERYAAIALAGHSKAEDFRKLDVLTMYEEMIVTGAWWDYVDDLAEHRVGPLLLAYPREMRESLLAWSRSPDMWKRRTSIICQMHFRGKVDRKLLYACIQPSLSSKEFFLRKAIGWALRQLAWYDVDEVIRYVKEHESELSSLSKREALKHVARLKDGSARSRAR